MLIFYFAFGDMTLPFFASFFSMSDGSVNRLSYFNLSPTPALLLALLETYVYARLFYLECLDFLSFNKSPTLDGEILGCDE